MHMIAAIKAKADIYDSLILTSYLRLDGRLLTEILDLTVQARAPSGVASSVLPAGHRCALTRCLTR